MKKRQHLEAHLILTLTLLFMIFTAASYYFLSPAFTKQAFAQSGDMGPVGCAVWNTQNTSADMFYEGFGVPWSVVSPTQEMVMKAVCTKKGIQLSVGSNEANEYVWQYGYITSPHQPWTRIAFRGGGKVDGWYKGGAFVSIPSSKVLEGGANYLLAYVCSDTSEGWKCGCRDGATCDASGHWKLQEVYHQVSLRGGMNMKGAFSRAGYEDPTIFYLSKYEAMRGNTVLVYGGGFQGVGSVVFPGYGKIPANVNQTGTGLTFVVPDNMPYGKYNIWLTGADEKSNKTVLVVKDPQTRSPALRMVRPEKVSLWGGVTVHGSGFLSSGNMVITNLGIIKNVSSRDGKTLTFSLPRGTTKIPDEVRDVMKKHDLSEEAFFKFQKKMGQSRSFNEMQGVLRVVNDHGVSNQIKFTIVL